MVVVLARHRLRLWWAGLTRGPSAERRRLSLVFTALVGLFGLGFFFLGGYAVAAGLQESDPATLPALLPAIFVAGAAFVLLSQTGAILHQLYLASDLELLLAAPVPLRTLFVVKLVEILLLGGLVGLAQVAALAGYGRAVGAPAGFYLLTAPLMAVVLTISTAISMTLIMLLTRVLPPARVRGMLTLLAAALGAAVWLLLQVGSAERARDASTRLAPAVRGGAGGWAPTTWAADALLAAQEGRWGALALNLGALAALATALIGLAFQVFRYTFYVSQGRFTESVGRAAPAPPGGRSRLARLLGPLPGPVRAIAVKDWRVQVRDARLLGGLIFPLVMAGFFTFRLVSGAGNLKASPELSFWSALLVVPAIIFFVGGQLTLTAVGREGAAFALLRLAPLGAGRLLAAKAVAGFMPLAVLTWAVTLAAGVWRGAAPLHVVTALAMDTWLAAGFAAAGTVSGALRPAFDADNPQRSAGCLASVVELLLGGLFLGTSIGLFAWLMAVWLDELPVSGSVAAAVAAVLVAGVVASVALICGVGLVAARGLERWELE